MILKSLSRRNNTLQLVGYLFKQEKNEKPQPILKHNLRSRSVKGWAKEFDQNESLRLHKRKDNIKINHTILSFSTKDKEYISKSLLKDVSKKFVELRGKDNVYLVSSHHDRQHIHLHIIMSGTKYLTGESNRISKKEFHELKLALDSYQKEKYPKLIHSLPEHGKALKYQASQKDLKFQNRGEQPSQKQQILEATDKLYSRSKSLDHFLSQLKSKGYEPYYRGGQLYGLENQEGRHFRFKTIGYEKDRLEELDRQGVQQQKALKEIRDLRDSKNLEKEEEHERNIDEEIEEDEDDSVDSDYDDTGI